MATKAAVTKVLAGYASDEVRIIEWGPLTTTDLDGAWIDLPLHRDISIHVYGTFGAGATVTIQGSNEVVASPTAPVTLNGADQVGAAPFPLTYLTAGGNAIRQVLDAPVKVRPLLSGGDGTTSLTVALKAVRSRG